MEDKTIYRVVSVMRCALADLVEVMPKYEPSGDRTHPGWQTIEELREMVALFEGNRKVYEDYPGEYPGREAWQSSERNNLRDWIDGLVSNNMLAHGQSVVLWLNDLEDTYKLEVESGHGTVAGTWDCNTKDEEIAIELQDQLKEVLEELGYKVLASWDEEE